MNEELNDLQRKTLSRRQQHYAQCATVNSLTLVVVAIVIGFVSAFLWDQTIPSEFGVDAEYAASFLQAD